MDGIRFRDHEEFHGAALRMALVGAVLGVLAYLTVPFGGPWALGLIAGGTVVAAMAPVKRRLALHIAPRVVLAGAAVFALWAGARWGEPRTGQALFGLLLATAFAFGLRGRRFLIAVGAGAVVALLARHALGSIATAQELSSSPSWLLAAAAGSAFSFVSILAVLPRHVELVRDPIGERYQALRPKLDGEIAELVTRAHSLWTEASTQMPEGDTNRDTLAEGVLRVFAVAESWSSSSADETRSRADSLVERMEKLDARIDATDDTVAKSQYEEAKAALAEQLRYLNNIGTSRERVLARMHNYLAAMERLRLAVVNLETTNASRVAEVEPLVTNIAEIGEDIDACAEVLGEA
jgi:hypothetical protein